VSCSDPTWVVTTAKKQFVFSQYSSNVAICGYKALGGSAQHEHGHHGHGHHGHGHHGHGHGHHHGHKHNDTCAHGWAPRAGGFNGVWDISKAFSYSNGLEFSAKGNDIYLAVFDKGSATWSHLIIMSGWSNTETHVYKNGNINTAICVNKMTIKDVNAENKFKVEYDTKDKKINLWYNGVQYVSCVDPTWVVTSAAKEFVFSQYSTNVKICGHRRLHKAKKHHKRCKRHHKRHHHKKH